MLHSILHVLGIEQKVDHLLCYNIVQSLLKKLEKNNECGHLYKVQKSCECDVYFLIKGSKDEY